MGKAFLITVITITFSFFFAACGGGTGGSGSESDSIKARYEISDLTIRSRQPGDTVVFTETGNSTLDNDTSDYTATIRLVTANSNLIALSGNEVSNLKATSHFANYIFDDGSTFSESSIIYTFTDSNNNTWFHIEEISGVKQYVECGNGVITRSGSITPGTTIVISYSLYSSTGGTCLWTNNVTTTVSTSIEKEDVRIGSTVFETYKRTVTQNETTATKTKTTNITSWVHPSFGTIKYSSSATNFFTDGTLITFTGSGTLKSIQLANVSEDILK